MCLTTTTDYTELPKIQGPRSLKKLRSLEPTKESVWTIAKEVAAPFLMAGLGVVMTGLSLDRVQHWAVFRNHPALVVLVPALLGLKGNLEMTLASRLSTQANLGMLEMRHHMIRAYTGNMALLLCQATIVGTLAAALALATGGSPLSMAEVALVCCSSVGTALMACLLLGTLTMGVVFASHRLQINPDNVAAPLASAFGDVTTLWLLTGTSYILASMDNCWVMVGLLLAALSLTPMLALVARGNPSTRQALKEAWPPIILGIFLSSGSGLLLSVVVKDNHALAAFQPVINGVGGNLVAIHASKMSTFLHKELPTHLPLCFSPSSVFSKEDPNGLSARALLAVGIPGHAVFLTVLCLVQPAGSREGLPAAFLVLYVACAALQVTMLLYTTQVLVTALWKVGVDPDNTALPCLTALGDLLGTALLAAAFYLSCPI